MQPRHLVTTVPLALIALAMLATGCPSNDGEKRTLVISGAVHVYSVDTPPAGYPVS